MSEGRPRIVAAFLATTALTTALLVAACPPDAHARSGKAKTQENRPARAAAETPLDPRIAETLRSALWGGKRSLVAGVFDAVHRDPRSRDSVLSYSRSLAPSFGRELAKAADLGVLTAGKTLALSPRAEGTWNARQLGFASAPSFSASAAAAPRALPVPAPPAGDQTWHLDLIGASVAYGRGFTGQGVTVAVADTSFDITNDALRNKLDLSRAMNYILNTASTPYDPSFVGIQAPADNHGSHVAGIVAAEKLAGVDMHGVAYNAKVVPIRTILGGPDAPLAVYAPGMTGNESLHYFASLANVKVYNASYGPGPDDDSPPLSLWPFGVSAGEVAGVMQVLRADKIIVAAAGNERRDHPVAGRNPSGLALMPFIQPAHDGAGVYDLGGPSMDLSMLQHQKGLIISVMSVGRSKNPAAYSNLCGVTASWCVAAPGGDMPNDPGIFSTVPDNTYGFLHGTSMAAPTVSGALAVLIEAYPDYNARDLARVLFSTAEDLGEAGVDAVFGYGLIRLDRATDGPTTLAASSAVTVNAGDTAYWSRPLVAAGDFSKQGDGILTIAGRTTAPGNVHVTAGTLAVDGTLTVTGNGHALVVGQGGTLAGIGDVFGPTTIAGTLSPGRMPNVGDLIANGVLAPGSTVTGNSPGTLTFNGSVTLTATATTRIDIDGDLRVPGGPGTYDKIVVSGANHVFTAGGALIPVLRGIAGGTNRYTPTLGTQFKFVEAQSGAQVAGAFATVAQPGAGLAANTRLDVAYTPTSIALAVTPLSFASLGDGVTLNNGQTTVARILDSVRNAPSARAATVLNAMYLLTSDRAYADALLHLGGPGQPATAGAVMSTFASFGGAVGTRQAVVAAGGGDAQSAVMQGATLGYAGAATAVAHAGQAAFASLDTGDQPAAAGWSVWGQAFGRWSSVGADSQGLPGSSDRSAGFAIGADRPLAPDLIGGMAMGFARTTTASAGTNATSDTYTGSFYATWTPGRFVVDGRVAAGPTLMSTSRNVAQFGGAGGRANGFGGLAAGEIGYRIPVHAVTLKPFVGLEWQSLHRRAFEENSVFGLSYGAQTFTKLMTRLGASASTRISTPGGLTVMPELRAAWAHDLRDTTLTTRAALLDNAFTADASAPGRDAAQLGLTLTGWKRENFRLFASYNAELRRNAQSHEFSGGGRWSW